MSYCDISRRDFLLRAGFAVGGIGVGIGGELVYGGVKAGHKKVIVIGIDGMDPVLSEKMMDDGRLPNFARMREAGGYSKLGTSTPPQSPVAWANFINGAGPGSHGIFDFIHRRPEHQVEPFFSAAEMVGGSGYWEVGDHKLQMNFWPFNHKAAETVLRRKGVPFWDHLDKAGISSTFYDLPSNYPPSPSKYGNHKCLSGMGTPDMLGTYGTYQHYSEDGPVRTKRGGGGNRSMLFFENERAEGTLIGPVNSLLKNQDETTVDFVVHKDVKARTALIEIQGKRILLKEGQWSDWMQIEFELKMPKFLLDKVVTGICRFYVQEVGPNFRLYVTPVNIDPSAPANKITEPAEFVEEISDKLGLFYTTGFQEDHKALSNKIFTDEEYVAQAAIVLQERLNLLDYAIKNYDDGLLFFYFSSTDMQAHMLWWDSDDKHPTRNAEDAKKYFGCLKDVYMKLDGVVGDVMKRYGEEATIIVMSDHGFGNFRRQFNLNTWLKENGYLGPAESTSLMSDVDWKQTRAYGLGINGLYLNLKGRERDGIVEKGKESEALLEEIKAKLEAIRDVNGEQVIRSVARTDKIFKGNAMELAPDLIVGYSRGYRASWDTCLGDMNEEVLWDNDSPWAADHCADAKEVPGVLFCNKPIAKADVSLVDIAPTILVEYGLGVPAEMEGKDFLKG